jgi:hypothetical protein
MDSKDIENPIFDRYGQADPVCLDVLQALINEQFL